MLWEGRIIFVALVAFNFKKQELFQTQWTRISIFIKCNRRNVARGLRPEVPNCESAMRFRSRHHKIIKVSCDIIRFLQCYIYVWVVMAFITAVSLRARSQNSLPSVPVRRVYVVLLTVRPLAEECRVLRPWNRRTVGRHPECLADLAGIEPKPLAQ